MIRVIWSKNASEELKNIIDYWEKRNKSKNYTKKLEQHIKIALELVKKHQEIGVASNYGKVRMRLVLRKYYIIYKFKSESELQILNFWDCRRNPLNIKYKKNDGQ